MKARLVSDERIMFEVEENDTGIGISSNGDQHLFAPLWKGQVGIHSHSFGASLCLCIAKRLT